MVAVYAVSRHFWKQLGTEPSQTYWEMWDVQTCASQLSCTASINPTKIYKNVLYSLDMFFRRHVHVIPWGCGLCCESGSAPAVCRWGWGHRSRALLSRPLGRLPPRAILRWVRLLLVIFESRRILDDSRMIDLNIPQLLKESWSCLGWSECANQIWVPQRQGI